MTDAAADALARGSLVERLFRAFSMQLSDIEARIADKAGEGIVDDGRILSGLAKTLETLVSVERKLIQVDDEEATVNLDGVRTELAERLAKLRAGLGKDDLGRDDDAASADPA